MEETALFPSGPKSAPSEGFTLILPSQSKRPFDGFKATAVRVWVHLQFIMVIVAAYVVSVLPQILAIADITMSIILLSFVKTNSFHKLLLGFARAISVFVAGLFLYELRPARKVTTWIAIAICALSIGILSTNSLDSVVSASGITISILELISLGIIGRRKIIVPSSQQAYQSLTI